MSINDERGSVLAVHESDLEVFLKDLDIFDRLNEGIPCSVCEVEVTISNLGYIFFINDEINICCDNIECFYEVSKNKKVE